MATGKISAFRLSKREYIACRIMAAIRAGAYKTQSGSYLSDPYLWSSAEAAKLAIQDTDELLRQLES